MHGTTIKIVLYMFRTNNFSSSEVYFCTCNVQYFPSHRISC